MSGGLDTHDGQEALSRYVPQRFLPVKSLEELSGITCLPSSEWVTDLVEQVERSWVIPRNELRCEQVRELVGQRFALQWLAKPVAHFVAHYPQADCGCYPGDLSVNALRALEELSLYAPTAVALMIEADFSWLRIEADQDEFGSLYEKAWVELTKARSRI